MELKVCKFCLSEIPAKAQKCKFCGEWQEYKEIEEISGKDATKGVEYTMNLKAPFQFSLIKWIPLHYAGSVFIASLLIFVIVQFSWYILDENRIYLLSILAYTIQMMVVWTAIIWFYHYIKINFSNFLKISSHDSNKIQLDLVKYQGLIFNKKLSLLAGIAIGLTAAIGDFILGTPFESLNAKLIYAVFQFITMFFAGAAVYSLVLFSLFIYTISKSNHVTTIDFEKRRSVHYIGSIHLKTSMIAIIPLFLGVLARLIGDWNWEFLIILWYASFAFLIVIYIYWPMVNIHNLMKSDVNHQVSIVQGKIQKVLKEINFNPSSHNLLKLSELRQLENSLSSQNTWPFDLKSISAAFIAIIFPIILIVIDKIWSI